MRNIYQKSNKKAGFTLIELLVVIAIIGLLSTLAVVALNSARQKARDAKRVADIKQVQTALELFFNERDGYPSVVSNQVVLGEVTDPDLDCGPASTPCSCLDQNGFRSSANCGAGNAVIYMGLVPANPRPPADSPYFYGGMNIDKSAWCATGVCPTYRITFDLESAIPSLGAGTSCVAEESGVTCS